MVKYDPINTSIYLAKTSDRSVIKTLIDREKETFGFITQGVINKAIEESRVWMAYHSTGMAIGFIIFYHCKRLTHTSIREIFVRTPYRRHGIGKRLITMVYEDAKREGKEKLRLKCPTNLDEANKFYKKMGFTLTETVKGKKRELNVWEKRVEKK